MKEELGALFAYLKKRDPQGFKQLGDDSFEISEPREAWLIASNTWDSFFLNEISGNLNTFTLTMNPAFHGTWARDYFGNHAGLASGKKIVKFFPYWITMAGYSGRDALYRTRRAREKRLAELWTWMKEEKIEPCSCLFIPYHHYNLGDQVGESFYHYIAGRIFKDMGYVVCNEYAPFLVTETMRTPDLSAFRSAEIEVLLSLLRKKGIISSGAFMEELEMYCVFGEQSFKAGEPGSLQSKPLTDVESALIEVKRGETAFNLKRGRDQVRDYLIEAYGLYEEGYLMASMLEEEDLLPGEISISQDGGVLFSRAERAKSEFTTYWNERKKRQLGSVIDDMLLQLRKNCPVGKTVSACERFRDGDIQSYDSLLNSIRAIDPESTIEDVLNSPVYL
jgi:hypothetical protein